MDSVHSQSFEVAKASLNKLYDDIFLNEKNEKRPDADKRFEKVFLKSSDKGLSVEEKQSYWSWSRFVIRVEKTFGRGKSEYSLTRSTDVLKTQLETVAKKSNELSFDDFEKMIDIESVHQKTVDHGFREKRGLEGPELQAHFSTSNFKGKYKTALDKRIIELDRKILGIKDEKTKQELTVQVDALRKQLNSIDMTKDQAATELHNMREAIEELDKRITEPVAQVKQDVPEVEIEPIGTVQAEEGLIAVNDVVTEQVDARKKEIEQLEQDLKFLTDELNVLKGDVEALVEEMNGSIDPTEIYNYELGDTIISGLREKIDLAKSQMTDDVLIKQVSKQMQEWLDALPALKYQIQETKVELLRRLPVLDASKQISEENRILKERLDMITKFWRSFSIQNLLIEKLIGPQFDNHTSMLSNVCLRMKRIKIPEIMDDRFWSQIAESYLHLEQIAGYVEKGEAKGSSFEVILSRDIEAKVEVLKKSHIADVTEENTKNFAEIADFATDVESMIANATKFWINGAQESIKEIMNKADGLGLKLAPNPQEMLMDALEAFETYKQTGSLLYLDKILKCKTQIEKIQRDLTQKEVDRKGYLLNANGFVREASRGKTGETRKYLIKLSEQISAQMENPTVTLKEAILLKKNLEDHVRDNITKILLGQAGLDELLDYLPKRKEQK